MVIISMTKKDNTLALKVEGHAGQAEKGHDLVCASVSTLVYTLAQYIESMYEKHQLKCRPLIELAEGNTRIEVKPKTNHMAEGLHAFSMASSGFHLLSFNYPENVTFHPFE